MSPNWLSDPKHVVAGAVLGFALVAVGWNRVRPVSLLALLSISLVALAELMVELLEYPLVYAGEFYPSAYYDTIADLADTMVGGLVGVVGALIVKRRRRVSDQ